MADDDFTVPSLKEMAQHIATAFDVPLEVLGIPDPTAPPPEHVNHPAKTVLAFDPIPHPDLGSSMVHATVHQDGTITVEPTMPLSNHSWGTSIDYNSVEGVDHIHFEPSPGAAYLEGDGDIDTGPKPKVFTLLGKAAPVVIAPAQTLVWETDLGKIVQQGKHCAVTLTGVVSTEQGMFKLGAELVTLDVELAKKLIGVTPNDGPGTGAQFLHQAAGNQLFTWEAGTGWVPKAKSEPLMASGGFIAPQDGTYEIGFQSLHGSFPQVSTAKGGVKFDHEAWADGTWETDPVDSYPDAAELHWDGMAHTTETGDRWEWKHAGGWRRTAEAELFSDGEMAPHGWFCSYCGEHATVHGGDIIGCDSGGWLRPATSAEHKQALLGLK